MKKQIILSAAVLFLCLCSALSSVHAQTVYADRDWNEWSRSPVNFRWTNDPVPGVIYFYESGGQYKLEYTEIHYEMYLDGECIGGRPGTGNEELCTFPLLTGSHTFFITKYYYGAKYMYIRFFWQDIWLYFGMSEKYIGQSNTVNVYVDEVPPVNASSCTDNGSESGVQTYDNDPCFSWSGAGDAHSGIGGYYYYWGTDPNGISDAFTPLPGIDPAPLTADGTYYLRVKTEDHVGNTSGWSTLYTYVYTANQPPAAHAGGPYTADEGSPVMLDASASSDPYGDTLQYRWDLDNDGTWDTAYSADATLAHTWNDDCIVTVTVEVYDGELTDTASAEVTVNNVAPVLTISGASGLDEGAFIHLTSLQKTRETTP